MKRLYEPGTIEAADLLEGRVEPHYIKTLTRLLAAHAIAEKLTAVGYQLALENISDDHLRPTIEKNLAEERKHARLVYQILGQIGTSETNADRSMIPAMKSPSFAAPHCRAAEIILDEEENHENFANAELHDAVDRFGAVKVNAAIREWLPRAVNFFGPPGSGFTFDCLRYGLKARDNGEVAEMYLTLIERRLDQAGLEMPRLTPVYPHTLA